jgi:hypothetical protein
VREPVYETEQDRINEREILEALMAATGIHFAAHDRMAGVDAETEHGHHAECKSRKLTLTTYHTVVLDESKYRDLLRVEGIALFVVRFELEPGQPIEAAWMNRPDNEWLKPFPYARRGRQPTRAVGVPMAWFKTLDEIAVIMNDWELAAASTQR